MKQGIISLFLTAVWLFTAMPTSAQQMDPDTVWPLCARITENPPRGWRESKGCPPKRFGNPAYTDAPFSSTFGPRLLGSENDRYDFHRGVDIATPSGTPIFAITGGNVEIAGSHSTYSDPLIKLRHYRPGETTCTGGGGCYHSYYLHISDWVVSVDDSVEKGQLIGYTGASGASGFQHLHFEVRDAPAFDPFSAWSRDAVHPLDTVPYEEPNNTGIFFNSVDPSDPSAVAAEVTVTSNRYDLISVEMAVFDASHQEIPQVGNIADNGYHVLPSFYDMEAWNFEYSHKDSSAYPWEAYGAGGPYECPYYSDHGSSYSAHVHMDAQHPDDYQQGLFNGVHVVTNKYWLTGGLDYWLKLEFLALQGPASCIEATAVFAAGDTTTAEWGSCENTPPPNEAPIAAFSYICDGLECSFNGGASSDSDGSITGFDWDFGDGASATGVNASHGFASTGSYSVSLMVTDDDGATDSAQQTVIVEEPEGGDISASVSTNKKRNKVTVTWSGASGNKVDIYRNGWLLSNTRNDGNWSDRDVSAGNTYTYQVCEAGSASVCSNEASISL
jgi:hypothetical protein